MFGFAVMEEYSADQSYKGSELLNRAMSLWGQTCVGFAIVFNTVWSYFQKVCFFFEACFLSEPICLLEIYTHLYTQALILMCNTLQRY